MTFKTYIKAYIKEHRQVTLSELDFQREAYNKAYNSNIKFSTMERTLRRIVAKSQKNFELLGYRIDKIVNNKGYITGYITTTSDLISIE